MKNDLNYNGKDLILHTALRFYRARDFNLEKAKN